MSTRATYPRAYLDPEGKAPGGYQCALQERRVPFIFMNASGGQLDVMTLLHEGGHAIHCLESRHLRFMPNRRLPIEFAEVASMAMELLGSPHLDVFYDTPAEVARARLAHFDSILALLPWIASIDAFQHWLYTHPGHERWERRAAWLAIPDRYHAPLGVDWQGLAEIRGQAWLRQPHLFTVPFYFIEYGIAQLGALQILRNHRRDPAGTIVTFRRALSLGNTRPLPELFKVAGLRFDFSARTLTTLMETMWQEIETLEQ